MRKNPARTYRSTRDLSSFSRARRQAGKGERKFLTSVMQAHNARIMSRRCIPLDISHNPRSFHVSVTTSGRFTFVRRLVALQNESESDTSIAAPSRGKLGDEEAESARARDLAPRNYKLLSLSRAASVLALLPRRWFCQGGVMR